MRSVSTCRRAVVPSFLAVLLAGAARAQATAPEASALAGWVPASAMRLASGRPGPGYWQQRVDYVIEATLDPVTDTLRGEGRITYHNRSPAALGELWLHLEQNICAPGSEANLLDQPPLVFLTSTFDFSCRGFSGGLVLGPVRVDGGEAAAEVHGTTMRVGLARPVPPGGTATLDLAWRFKVPPYGAARMGHDGTLYEIAQWYPRLAVYDDVKGWNHEPYTGAGEFYLEYGRFDVALTLPASYVVAATGVLQNPGEVLTAAQRERLARARTSDAAIGIIAAEEAGTPGARPRQGGTLTWRFSADSVRDFAFAAAPDFRWDASGYDGILIHTYYRPTATLWPEANRMAREAVKHFSETWLRYPYPHASSVEGPIEGMEYPMLAFDPAGPAREDLQWVVAHELGHQWVPMIVGSNERLYPWMDEGFNTFIDLDNAAKYFAGTAYGDTIGVHPLRLYRDHAVPGREQPLITRPVESRDLFWTGYQKPALMLQTLRHHVLGPARFDPAFRAYLEAWAFRHPTPADFFRIMRDRTGVDLDWYWRDWVYTVNRPDQAVESIEHGPDGAKVTVANRGTMQLPIFLRLTFDDGTTESLRLPVDAWNQGPRYTRTVTGPRRVVRADVDPEGWLPDDDRGNNVKEVR
ncbi:MAG TPA: M1 family metallopeptidase [Gemmatimonadales bacterium]|nr:M1 family metallopeptidase [Gemmatimonadales bacterium]